MIINEIEKKNKNKNVKRTKIKINEKSEEKKKKKRNTEKKRKKPCFVSTSLIYSDELYKKKKYCKKNESTK